MEKDNLIAYIKMTSQNIKTLHRHLVGGAWFVDHEQLAEYYEKIDEFEDSIVENFLAIGMEDVSIDAAVAMYPALPVRDYTSTEAFSLCKFYFEKLLRLLKEFKQMNELPHGVKAKFEECEEWLSLESRFKLSRLLIGTDFQSVVNNLLGN